MTPKEVTAVIQGRLRRHADFTHLSVNTQSALNGRYNVCTIIAGGNYRFRARVLGVVMGPDVRGSEVGTSSTGAIVVTLKSDRVIR